MITEMEKLKQKMVDDCSDEKRRKKMELILKRHTYAYVCEELDGYLYGLNSMQLMIVHGFVDDLVAMVKDSFKDYSDLVEKLEDLASDASREIANRGNNNSEEV